MATLLLSLFLMIPLAAQGTVGGTVGGLPQDQPRDPRAKPLTGTGSITGKVTAADTGAPLRRASVNLSGSSIQRTTLTDSEGRYKFTSLPPGTFNVVVNAGPHRAGYQSLAYGASAGASSMLQRSKPIELAEGQRVENIDIALPRTGVITGRVTDADGEPASRISVTAWIVRPGAEPSQVGGGQTDDLGQYRLFGLGPGEYVVMANPMMGFQAANQVSEGEPTGFALTYAPGTPVRAEAMRLRVGRGTEVAADIRLTETRVYSISGTVSNSKGEVVRTSVMLNRSDGSGPPGFGAMVTPNGAFVIRNVPPGEYDVIARYSAPADPSVPRPDANQELATVKVDVSTGDVEGLVLVTRPGATVTGDVVFDDPLPQGAHANLFAQSADRRPFMGAPMIELKEKTFTMRSVFGPVLLRGSVAAGPGWGLKAVLLNGKDITDVPTTFTASDSGHLQVVFTARAPGLEGLVLDDAGKPTMEATILVFGQDPATWQSRSSFVRTTRAIKDGKYGLNGLREGRYFAVAVPLDITVNIMQLNTELLENLSKVATPVLLNAGEKRTLDLTVVRVQQQ